MLVIVIPLFLKGLLSPVTHVTHVTHVIHVIHNARVEAFLSLLIIILLIICINELGSTDRPFTHTTPFYHQLHRTLFVAERIEFRNDVDTLFFITDSNLVF